MYRENVWEKYENYDEIMDFAEGYKYFITKGKTERLACDLAVKMLDEKGFKNGDKISKVKTGDKIYFVNKNKNVCAFVVGEKSLLEGMHILGAHIDSPRLDFKEHPLYEKSNFVYADTHYYGGIKKYQWVTIPLALHGVVCKKDGTSVSINIGDEPNDPVFGISDLLIHLAKDQMSKNIEKAIEGENLDVTLGSISTKNAKSKQLILDLLKQKYDIDEEDLLSSEIEVVPAGEAKDYGLDKSMIMGYGHDDRCCAYSSLKALLDIDSSTYTACCILVDKEEIGSVGATGAQSLFFENCIIKLLKLLGINQDLLTIRTVYENSKMLSSDVSAAFDPLYPSVSDTNNAAYFAQGIVFNKYTGRGGKSGSNDANPEYYAYIRNVMDNADVSWQNSELGKVDQGGGGTIAYILGNYNMNVIDAGIPVLNMHAPMEVISKADLYEAYKGYKAFILAK